MRKSLLYLLLLSCVSIFTTQKLNYEDSSAAGLAEIVQENFEDFEYSITEYTHEQSATRPTNVQVPSVSRTNSAHRSNSVNSPAGSALKSDLKSHNYPGALKYLNTNLLTAGFADSSSYFKSLCRLII
jgi:hypothetical protein